MKKFPNRRSVMVSLTGLPIYGVPSAAGAQECADGRCAIQLDAQYCKLDFEALIAGEPKKWGFEFRECTQFAAYKINSEGAENWFSNTWGGSIPNADGSVSTKFGDAENWLPRAKLLEDRGDNVRVGAQPYAGAIAWWRTLNHVAYVKSVKPEGTVLLEDYNRQCEHEYEPSYLTSSAPVNKEIGYLNRDGPDGYIYFGRREEGAKWAKGVPCVIRNKDNCLEIIYCGPDGRLYNAWQYSPGGVWSRSNMLTFGHEALCDGNVTAAISGGRIEIFFRGLDRHIYHMWQWDPGANWSTPAAFSEQIRTVGPLSATTNFDGRIELFAIREDRRVVNYWQWAGGGWGGPSDLIPGAYVYAQDAISATKDPGGRLHLAYIGRDRRVYIHQQKSPGGTDGWTNSLKFDFKAGTGLAIFSHSNGITYMNVCDQAGGIWEATTKFPEHPRSFGELKAISGSWASSIAFALNLDGRLEQFHIGDRDGTRDKIFHRWQTVAGTRKWSPIQQLA